jgi:hypothetical protein
MSHRIISVLVALVISLAGVGQATAGLVYDNGPINGTVEAWAITLGNVVTDSFTVTASTNLTGARIGLWVSHGDQPSTIDWMIPSRQLAGTFGPHMMRTNGIPCCLEPDRSPGGDGSQGAGRRGRASPAQPAGADREPGPGQP